MDSRKRFLIIILTLIFIVPLYLPIVETKNNSKISISIDKSYANEYEDEQKRHLDIAKSEFFVNKTIDKILSAVLYIAYFVALIGLMLLIFNLTMYGLALVTGVDFLKMVTFGGLSAFDDETKGKIIKIVILSSILFGIIFSNSLLNIIALIANAIVIFIDSIFTRWY